jgi:hypothetical protein
MEFSCPDSGRQIDKELDVKEERWNSAVSISRNRLTRKQLL